MNIIFIHKGDSWYLSYALKQAKQSNPDANIVLLGDNSNSKYANIVKHDLISNYFDKADEFRNIYKHFSTTGYQHELFCIQRWFVWFEYMKAHKIESAILPDTDVLIFQPIQDFIKTINLEFQFSKGTTNYMGFMYMKTKYLKIICDYFEFQYLDPLMLSELEKAYIDYVKITGAGGVSDITLFNRYEKENPDCALNFELPPINGYAFINSLDSPYYIHNKDGYVKFKWKKNISYATLLDGGDVSIVGVHCFGLQKEYIRKLYNGKGKTKSRLVFLWKRSIFKMIFDKLRGRKKK